MEIIKLFLGVVVISLAACASPPTEDINNISGVAEGIWGWSATNDCFENYHEIDISDDRKRMTVTFRDVGYASELDARKKFEYQILMIGHNIISTKMDNEPRVDEFGNPVTWNLVLLDDKHYCWQRGDWEPGQCTEIINRCPL